MKEKEEDAPKGLLGLRAAAVALLRKVPRAPELCLPTTHSISTIAAPSNVPGVSASSGSGCGGNQT